MKANRVEETLVCMLKICINKVDTIDKVKHKSASNDIEMTIIHRFNVVFVIVVGNIIVSNRMLLHSKDPFDTISCHL